MHVEVIKMLLNVEHYHIYFNNKANILILNNVHFLLNHVK